MCVRVCMYVCVCLCVQPLTNPALEFKVLYRNLDKGELDCESQIKAESKRARERGAVRAREAHCVWVHKAKQFPSTSRTVSVQFSSVEFSQSQSVVISEFCLYANYLYIHTDVTTLQRIINNTTTYIFKMCVCVCTLSCCCCCCCCCAASIKKNNK